MSIPAALLIVTGQSGAGHSTALNILEDIGFETIDNLPPSLIDAVFAQKPEARLAIGIDSRTRNILAAETLTLINDLRARVGAGLSLLFLECNEGVLLRRFSVTRRPHPFQSNATLSAAIAAERAALQPLKSIADQCIDTSTLTPVGLTQLLHTFYSATDKGKLPRVLVESFSYRNGLPDEADMVIDMRFLANPFYEEALQRLNGKNQEIKDFCEKNPDWQQFITPFLGLLQQLLLSYEKSGKRYFTLAFGCTGGQHRSVFAAEHAAEALRQSGWPVSIYHRELATAGGY